MASTMFVPSHQMVSLDIDMERRTIRGVTELSIEPTSSLLDKIRLHCSRPVVHKVSIDGHPCKFIRHGPQTRRQLIQKLQQQHKNETEEDLEIIIPTEQIQIEPVGESSYRQLKVRIEFYLVAPTSGVVFNESTVHTETRALEPNSTASTWLPCVDTRHDRPTWDLFYSVPACVGSAETQLLPLTVVSSGELSSLIVHPRDPARRMFRYTMLTPTPACMLGWAIGPFTSACSLDSSLLGVGNPNGENEQEVPDEKEEDDDDYAEETEQKADGEGEGEGVEAEEEAKASHNAKLNKSTVDAIGGVFAFTYGGHQEELENTCAFIPEALAFHSQEFGAYPYTTYKTVFMDGLQQPVVTCAALTLLSTDFLHPANIIEQVYETRRCLGLAIAHQWFGTYIVEETWSDHWLVAGLAGFTASLFVKHNLGVNEHRYRLKRDMARLCHADVNQKPISYASQKDTVISKEDREFISLKAPIVLHMLDRRMIKGGHSLGMHRIIGKLLVAAMSGELGASNAVGTAWFLKLCRKISNGSVDIREFADQWIKGSGCPVFHLGYAFNRKRLAVEITLHQESTNAKATAPWVKPTKLFRGQMTARIREADGTPYEHVLEIHERWKKFDVQFNTKYKRIRRSTKRFHLRQMAAAAEELNVNTEVLGLEDDGETYSNIALFGAENEQEKRDWRVVEWGEDDDESLASATFEWIRIDPDLEWACVLHFEQPDFMWAAQLHRDRDVAAQLEAVDALRHLKSAAASTTLMRTVMDARVFYRVRVDAALALESYATRELDWIGLHHLVKIYKRRYCLPPPSMSMNNESAEGGEGLGDSEDILAPRLPQPNNFASIGEYFTQKAVLTALSNVRDKHGEAPRAARQLLLGALQCNDNSENVYSDSYFISMLVRALTNTVVASKRVPSMEILREVERLRRSDLLVPSFHNEVTRACLDSLARVSVVQPQEHLFNTAMFCSMAIAPGCLPAVRQSAVAGLLLHWGAPSLLSLALASDTSCPELAVSTSRNIMQLAMIRALLHGQQHNSLLLMGQQSADGHIDRDVRLVGGMEALIDTLEEDGQGRFKTILASSIYDGGDANQHRLWLRVLYMLFYQTFDCSVPPPLPPAKKKLKIKLGKKKQPPSHEHRRSTASEDTPLALSMPPRDDIVDPYSLDLGTGDDYHEPLESAEIPLASTIGSYGLPAIAGTRPPAIVTKPSATEESTGAPKLKLKFKLGGGGSSTATGASTPQQPLTAATRKELPAGVPSTPEVLVGHKATAEDPLAMIRTGKSLGSIPKLPAETTKLLQKMLRKLCRLQGALPFLRPVDIMLDGCPTYYQVIKEPMDMGTMRRKLQKGLYENVDQFSDDMKKMLSNCYKFNPPGTPVYVMGQSVEAAFDKEWPKFLEENKRLPAQQQAKRKSTGAADGKEGEDGASKKKKKTKPKKPAATVEMAGSKGPSKLAHSIAMDSTQSSPIPSTSSSGGGVLKLKLATSKSQVQSPVATTEPSTAAGAAAPASSGDANDSVLLSEPTPPKPKSRDWVGMCRRVFLRLQAQPSALEFLAPVDPVRQGVPTYFDVVKQPMDLGTARKKLDRKQYKSPNEVKQDVQLVFSNCMLFNTPGTFVHSQCLALQEIFAKCWRQQTGGKDPDEDVDVDVDLLPEDLEMTDKAVERARGVISKLKREAYCWPFLKPVDPVALGVPTYFDLVKNPMDLSTIQKKLSRKKYQNVADFVADIQLILDDCFLFNIADTPVHECGKSMEKEAKELLKLDGWDRWLA